jgi:regulator of ribonuclease activity A
MTFSTSSLCDSYFERGHLQIADPVFNIYGANKLFSGYITTLKTFEDDNLMRAILEEKVNNRVLVIDGGGSRRCALLDATMAKLAIENGWQGLIVYGCIRDAVIINQLPIGVRALASHPLKSHKKDHGDRDLVITFAGINFKKDQFLYADTDGIIVTETMLS